MSEYHVATTDKPDELANVLMRALGEKGRKSIEIEYGTLSKKIYMYFQHLHEHNITQHS